MARSVKQKVFISYARKDGVQLAERLHTDLKARAFDVWLDTQQLGGGACWTDEIETALDICDVVLALLTPGSYRSEICRAEQLRALRKDKRLIPLLVDRTADIPLHLEIKNYLDFSVSNAYSKQFSKLVRDIGSSKKGARLPEHYQTTSASYITNPPKVMNYIERPEALRSLRDTLFQADGTIALTAIEGMGGVGKTVLAQALFEDEVVRDAFPDGVVWITAGRAGISDLSAKLREISKVLGGSREDDISPETLYKSTLAAKAALIIIDDIWSKADLDSFLAESPRSRFLFTTRDLSIVKFSGAREHRADLLESGQARELLALWAQQKVSQLPPAAEVILKECNGLPLALSMMGALLRRASPMKWTDVANLLRKADLTAIEEQLPPGQRSFFNAIDVSVKALSQELQQHYGELAVLLDDMPAPLTILQALWNKNADEGRRIAERLADRSLAQCDEAGSIRLHDLQLDYVRAKYPDPECLELIHGAVRLSSHVIAKAPTQFASQLVGRLLPYQSKANIAKFTAALKEGSPRPWLLPQQAALDSPGGALVRTLAGHTNSVNGVAISRDGRRAISASSDETLKVWDVERGRELWTLAGHTSSVSAVAIAEDGKYAVSGSRDKTLKVWDVESGRLLYTLKGHTDWVNGVGLSGDGSRAVSTSKDKTVKVWDVNRGQELRTLEDISGRGRGVAISGDGKVAISASDDDALRVWDVESGRQLGTLKGTKARITGVALSENGTRAVSSHADKTVKVWDTKSRRQLRSLVGHVDWVFGVAMSGDGRRVVSASDDKTVRVWDVESGRQLHTLVGHSTWVNGVAVSGDGKLIVSASRDRTVKVWNVESGQELPPLPGHTNSVNGVAVTGDGKLALSASDDNTVKMWDVESGRELRTLQGHTNSVNGVAVSGDGRIAISASSDEVLKVWDVENGKEVRALEGHAGVITGVTMSEDGKLAVSTSSDTTLKVWDVESGKNLRTLMTDTSLAAGVALSKDGRRVIAASKNKTIKVWDMKNGRALRTLKGHTNSITGVAISVDGRIAVSASGDKTVRVWDLEDGQESMILRGHTGAILGVAMSRDGRQVVSASDDNAVKVWDTGSGLELASFTCEGAAVCCAFCTSGTLVAGDAGGRVYFLKLILEVWESMKREDSAAIV